MTKNNKVVATDPDVSIIAHVTETELRQLLTFADIHNGFANRFAWFVVRRQKRLPFPKPMQEDEVQRLAEEIACVVMHAYTRDGNAACLTMSEAASRHWGRMYDEITEDPPGSLGAVTSRAEAQVLRFAMTYALLDGVDRIGIQHLEAALALWNYSFASAAYIFGQAELDPTAQRVIEFLSSGKKAQSKLVDLIRSQPSRRTSSGKFCAIFRVVGASLSVPRGRPRRVWSLDE